jgi:hypothetical protein
LNFDLGRNSNFKSIIFVHYDVHEIHKNMLVISSAELRNNMKKYLDQARDETIVIQRGRTETFVLSRQERLSPDADLARAISIDELLAGVKADIRQMYLDGK